jgi:hypothetical protein
MQNEITVVSSFFTLVPDNSGTQDEIEIILSNGNTLNLRRGDCLKLPTTTGVMTKEIEEFRPANLSEDIIEGETECVSIRFTDGKKLPRSHFDTIGIQKTACPQDGGNKRSRRSRRSRRSKKTRKPTKKVRRNRRANSRRN